MVDRALMGAVNLADQLARNKVPDSHGSMYVSAPQAIAVQECMKSSAGPSAHPTRRKRPSAESLAATTPPPAGKVRARGTPCTVSQRRTPVRALVTIHFESSL